MWDVIWTDPDKELVGEHRARKEKKRSPKADTISKDRPLTPSRSSFSTLSSVSSSDAALSFLRSQQGVFKKRSPGTDKTTSSATGTKSSWRSTAWSKSSSTASSALAPLSIPSARSPLSPTFDIRSRRSSGLATTNDSSLHSRPSIASQSANEAEAMATVDDKDGHNALDLHSTVNTVDHHQNKFESVEKNAVKLPRALPASQVDAEPPVHLVCEQNGMASHVTLPGKLASMQLNVDLHNKCLEPATTLEPCPSSSQPPAVPPKSPLRSASRSGSLISMPILGEEWLSATEWPQHAVLDRSENGGPIQNESAMLQLSAIQEELKSMAATDAPRILSQLKKFPEENRSAVQELQKKRWLMCTLQHLDRNSNQHSSNTGSVSFFENMKEALILFESSNTAAYFAAQHPTMNFYHVARHPLRNATFSNIIPLSLPSISTEILTHALPSGLDLIYSRSLSTLCPAPDLTNTLSSLRSHLKPGSGALHLTLIDAMPHPATLGPHLRDWLEKNLIINLSPYNLSHTPTRLVPKCLAAASLRGAGSRRIKTKFFASSSSIRGQATSEEERQHEDHDPDPAIRRLRSELRVKAELRCLVGRMLWMEAWGPYVTPCKREQKSDGATGDQETRDLDKAPSWWWDDDSCVTECLQLGTFWEYHTIEAVRGP